MGQAKRSKGRSSVASKQRVQRKVQRKYDAHPDRVDIRDWFYQPPLAPLPDQLVNCAHVPEILDQGSEGACTGFALAAVINYHLAARKLRRRVSPHMLYSMARRYDEWPGESYEGSSARGAMKGWSAHGVCEQKSWPDLSVVSLTEKLAEEAQTTPGGAYYRVTHRNVRDMHAALNEVGILYVTLMVHEGWDRPGPEVVELPLTAAKASAKTLRLPVIQRIGRAEDGHAVAIVGYTKDGFIVQNSWGKTWGAGGFALLPYEDYLLHATDVWVAQLGVPISLSTWEGDETAGLFRAGRSIPLADVRPYVIDVGNNGLLSGSGTYWTTEEDVRRLFEEVIHERTRTWQRRRVLLYLHGGLNAESAVAKRVVAYRDVMLQNEIYPLHIMWESGLSETLHDIVGDLFTDSDERAGSVADWWQKTREGLTEAKDKSLELTFAAPGGLLWREMKENARLASMPASQKTNLTATPRDGAMCLVSHYVISALKKLSEAERERWEVHVVGHSAGSIFAAHAMKHLIQLGPQLKSLQFMAPALSIDTFKQYVLPYVDSKACPMPTNYILSDTAERDDEVGPYAKSLLYLVSSAFESRTTSGPRKGKPRSLLGMARFITRDLHGNTDDVDPEIAKLFARKVDGRPSLVTAGSGKGAGSESTSTTHGGFDNDAATLNSVLTRILDKVPNQTFTERDLQFEGKSGASRGFSPRTQRVSLSGQAANTQVRLEGFGRRIRPKR